MSGKRGPHDDEIAQVAGRQWGVITLAQLIEIGLSQDQVDYRAASGRLHRLHRGVYAVGHPFLPPRGRVLAAVLACGPRAAASHWTAGWLLGLRRTDRADVDVSAPRGCGKHDGVVVHRLRRLDPEERGTVFGIIPVTSPTRTIVDLAPGRPRTEVERLFDQAERRGLLDLRAFGRYRGRRGMRLVNEILEDYVVSVPTLNEGLEETFYRLCRDSGLPLPVMNARVAGYTVDAYWEAQRLVVELDSREFHHTVRAFEEDRERDAALVAAGCRVIRLTHRRLKRPQAVVQQLRMALGLA